MPDPIPLHTTVALLEEVEADGVQLQRGETGCVIEERAPLIYELEMRDEVGRGYAFATVHVSQVLVLHHAGASDWSRGRHGVLGCAREQGVDLSMLRYRLKMTPSARVKHNELMMEKRRKTDELARLLAMTRAKREEEMKLLTQLKAIQALQSREQ